jgi:hypothetical protein
VLSAGLCAMGTYLDDEIRSGNLRPSLTGLVASE